MLELFSKAINNSCTNTSYPIDKSHWEEYKIKEDILFKNEDKLCLYIHIPFCNRLCAFCEYIKFKREDNHYEKEYVEILEKDIKKFLDNNGDFRLYGFDIGGGTPTSLSIDNFRKLMCIAKEINCRNMKIEDYEPSIEATFDTLTEEKIQLIAAAGFKRISLGIQTMNSKILTCQNRNIITLDKMVDIFNLIKKHDINKINVDFMYGIKGQKIEDIETSLECLKALNPEQVTLYEMRYNLINNKIFVDKETLYNQYNLVYKTLIKLGYIGRFGQNTFSKDARDLGLSSYLKYRMIDNISYKGFGISAQSKSELGISYNIGKKHEDIETCFKKRTFYADDIYLLPKEELVAKYVAISLYYGEFNLDIISNILKEDALQYFEKEIQFLKNNKYIEIKDNKVIVTDLGFKYYGAIGALFYSKKVKNLLFGGTL